MLSLVLIHLAMSQAPEVRNPVAIVITSKRPGAEQVAPKIAVRVFESFKREGVAGLLNDAAASKELRAAGFSDPKSCQGTRACLSKLAILLGPKAVVVGVDVGKVGKTLAIHLEAVAADREESLGTLDVSSGLTDWSDAMSAPIVVFVRDVKAGLEVKRKVEEPPPAPPLTVADAPRKAELTPPPPSVEAPVGDVVATKPARSMAVPAVLAGGAVAAAVSTAVFAVVAGEHKGRFDASLVDLPGGGRGSTLPEAEARALASTANTAVGLSIGSAVLTAGLAAVATYLFVAD